jgi:tetratricopeptide (TPR) repeat protein
MSVNMIGKIRWRIILLPALLISFNCFSQKQKADSLLNLLTTEKADSNRVTLMWKAADIMSTYEPLAALSLAKEALDLADAINFNEGKSRSTGIIANTHFKIGNYPKALEYNLLKLRIEEKNNKPRNLTSVLMNIGLVHAFQDEFRDALAYYFKADSVSKKYNVEDLRFNIALNMGDTYDKLNILDSAYLFYSNSKRIAEKSDNRKNAGTAMIGLGHVYRKQKNYLLSLESYKGAIPFIQEAHDDDLLCETYLGLAMLYAAFNNQDSAKKYALQSYTIGEADGFLSRQLDAARFITQLHRDAKNIDSAFAYVNLEKALNDSVNSRNKIRESQILAMNEQFRQQAIEQEKINEAKERKNRLQLLFIGIFIPALFLITLLVSRIRLHIRAIKLLGILSLLFFFEYLTLLLHPTVAALTNHTPILEILIFVGVAAILIPLHHKAEHWLVHKLLHRHVHNESKSNDKSGNNLAE